jgi:hypothetical protein
MWVNVKDDKRIGIWIQHTHVNDDSIITAITSAHLTDSNGRFISQGTARCVKPDQFKRHRGVQIALARALRAANLPKNERSAIWERVWCGKYQ